MRAVVRASLRCSGVLLVAAAAADWTYGCSNSPSWNFDRSTRRTAVSTVASRTTPPRTASSSGVP